MAITERQQAHKRIRKALSMAFPTLNYDLPEGAAQTRLRNDVDALLGGDSPLSIARLGQIERLIRAIGALLENSKISN